jgi:tRNA/tmRNA/rRNA uracil-C5-methylase (TrmA/RlmC/RlmD family)
MDNKKIKILEEIIKQNGDCHGISCNECPLQNCPLYEICTNMKYSTFQEFKSKNKNEAKKLLREIKLERILKNG